MCALDSCSVIPSPLSLYQAPRADGMPACGRYRPPVPSCPLRIWPDKPDTIFRFETSVGAMKPAELPLVTCKSTRRSGRAAWGAERHDIDIAPCVRLVA